MNISWYINRLRTMSVPELAFRVQQQTNRAYQKRRFLRYYPASVNLLSRPPKLLDTSAAKITDRSTKFDILGIEWDYSEPVDWHLCLRTGGRYPLVFCRDVNTRSDAHGIAKYAWEPNRHQFLTRVAMQYQGTGDRYFLQLFIDLLTSWKEQNPYLIGVNWYSNIEVNVRLINWFLAWEILDANTLIDEDEGFAKFVEEVWLPEIYLHCKYSSSFPSKFSSANNHLIAEGVGLFIGASYWKFPESARWKKHAKKIVEAELLNQHSPNGINKEETSEYIQFITDYFLISLVFAEANEDPFSPAYRERMREVLNYIYHLMDNQGGVNHYGDADDGRTFMLETETGFNNFQSLMTSAAILFNDPKFKARSAGMDTKNRVLFGPEGERTFEALEPLKEDRPSMFWVDEGHFFFRKEEGEQEILAHFDAAPLGYLAIAAHGHADALSFNLTLDGKKILVDPGTFSYHTDMPWRNYFVSTLAHNTITIDGQNQALRGGPTMWRDHYQCLVLEAVNEGEVERVKASHNGYAQTGVMHERTVEFDREKEVFTITDQIEVTDGQKHILEIPFHLHPEVEVNKVQDHQFLLKSTGDRAVEIHLDPALDPEIRRGEEDPIMGWYSPRFYQKSPAPVIYSRIETDKNLTLRYQIAIITPSQD